MIPVIILPILIPISIPIPILVSIPIYSNPDVKFKGAATGDKNHNSAALIRKKRYKQRIKIINKQTNGMATGDKKHNSAAII